MAETAEAFLQSGREFLRQPGVGMKNVVAASLVAERGPGHQAFAGVCRGQTDHSRLAPKRRGRIDRPGIGTEAGVPPFDERRDHAAVGRVDSLAVLSAEEASI